MNQGLIRKAITFGQRQAAVPALMMLLLAGPGTATWAYTPPLSELPLADSVSKNGITWTFSQPVRAGTFVNGDYYVVGPATVTAISPAPTTGPDRNGSVLNIQPGNQGSIFDDRAVNYNARYRTGTPVTLAAGDALVSTISVTTLKELWCWLSPDNNIESYLRTAAVLTCVAAPLPADAFRPAYCDRGQKVYCADSLRWDLLPNLTRVSSMTAAKLAEWTQHFSKSPWLDVCFFGFDTPTEYMPGYGAEIGRATGIASLFLMCDFSRTEKESLMVGFVQYGIDLWGIVRACNASRGWQAHGGHGTGRKWPMVFAGLMLGDTEMVRPTITYPALRIGEDMQTGYDACWTGATVVYTGHTGLWNGQPVSSDPVWGPYEHLPPAQWPGNLGEDYRRCCTSQSWIAQGLSAMLLNAQGDWDHPPFFDYCDRWMTENDATLVQTILQQTGLNYTSAWQRQRQTWDVITNAMWATYRSTVFISPAAGERPAAPRLLTPNPVKAGEWARYLKNRVGVKIYDVNGHRMTADAAPLAGIYIITTDNVIHTVMVIEQ